MHIRDGFFEQVNVQTTTQTAVCRNNDVTNSLRFTLF
ncbi:Uncharacterised protein [Vibrio cholerae]|nr:Uncharacterised protein [Vibrio cholerae]CSI47963.1 Uncharacterised protein [Vibrio cholerae]